MKNLILNIKIKMPEKTYTESILPVIEQAMKPEAVLENDKLTSMIEETKEILENYPESQEIEKIIQNIEKIIQNIEKMIENCLSSEEEIKKSVRSLHQKLTELFESGYSETVH